MNLRFQVWLWRVVVFGILVCSGGLAQGALGKVAGITLNDPTLKVELLDSHPDEFFLSHDMDLAGRLFVGSREAVFVYGRRADGGFQERRELYRFPKDTWVYDLEAFGDDLLILANTALFRLRDVNGDSPRLEKILWGNPLGHHHQGLHGIEFAPDGRLLIAMGDPHPGVHLDKNRPDHLWLWTWYVGPQNRPVPYAGVGAVMSLDLENYDLSIYAGGLRNPCGISFDRDWNLFANDNDQEGSTANPCRLVAVPRYSWNGWARGWDASQVPGRLDMIPNVNWTLDVPVGQGFYDHTTLGTDYRGSLLVANWGSRSVDQYPIKSVGAGFRAESRRLLQAEGERRPVSVMPMNDGRLVVSVCYMKGNEGSPRRKTDLLLISPRDAKRPGEFNHLNRSPVELLSEPIQLRAKAHREILRQGGTALEKAAKAFAKAEPGSPAFSSLIFLAAANGDAASIERISALAKGNGRAATLAWRAAAAFPANFTGWKEDLIQSTAEKQDQPTLLTGLIEFLHSSGRPVSDAVATLAAHDDSFVRQAMAILLARRASAEQLDRLAGGTANERLAASLATSFRIWEQAEKITELPDGSTVAVEKRMKLLHPEGPIDLRDLGASVGTYSLAQWWLADEVRKAHHADFARLRNALLDPDKQVANTAAIGLFFLNDKRLDSRVASVLAAGKIKLSIAAARARKKDLQLALNALKDAKLPTDTEIPEAFRNIDWDAPSAPAGNVAKGKSLFAARGCVACHLDPHDGTGGAIGPSLVGIGKRFPASYLATSILAPNLTVSPNFHPNTITMKDGAEHTGFVEPGAAKGKLTLRIITGQIVELNRSAIAKQDVSEQSMMPTGLVQTPAELADLIAYMRHTTAAKTAASPVAEETIFRSINPNAANSIRFAPTKARFVRIQIRDTNKGSPCIDELEVFAGESPKNLSLQSNGAKASASSLLKGHPEKHQIEFLNDGRYGNRHSWIPARKTGWAQIELPAVTMVDRVVFSRDRRGQISARNPISIDILLSVDGKAWTVVKKVRPPKDGKPSVPAPVVKRVKVALDETGFVSLFDGKSLDQWDHREGAWEIADGAISCTGREKTRNWIIWRGGTPADFILRLEFKYGAGNSGVQVRSDDLGDHQVFGYQVEIAPQKKMGLWHHSLLGKEDPAHDARFFMAIAGQEVTITADGEKSAKQVSPAEAIVAHFDESDWNTMEITAEGNTLVQKINGVVFSKVTDDDARMSRRRGVIALQDHGKGCQVAFRNIRLKESKPIAKPAEKKSAGVRGKPNPDRPNIVLILSDDMGYSDLPKFGTSEIPTPNLDRLADEGTMFSNAYVTAPICIASRMGLMSGQNQQRFGIYGNIYGESKIRKFQEQTLLPAVFQQAGYRTGLVGKWHLNGANKRPQYSNGHPLQRGFDEFVGIRGGDSHFWKGSPIYRNSDPEPFPAPEYLTDLWGTEACDFIDRNRKKPFFLYLAYNAVHAPMHALEKDRKPFEKIEDENRRTYDGMLLAMDRSIGRVLDRLDKHGLAENTIVVFLNDNGGGGSTEQYAPHSRNFANNLPLRGYKFDVLEGGVRVPMIVRWPGQVPAGTVYPELVSSTDVFPTLVKASGSRMPQGQPTDGVDLVPYLKGELQGQPHDWLCWQNRSRIPTKAGALTKPRRMTHNSAIRKGDWKLVRLNESIKSDAQPPAWQLYDLKTDIGERNNVADGHKDVVKELASLFEAWRASMAPTVE